MFLNDRYEVLERLARGGTSTLYHGRDTHANRSVAIKVLRDVYSTEQELVTRFQQAAQVSSTLKHSNIVEVYDYGQSENTYYVIMELVEGTHLRRYLRSRGTLSSEQAIIIAHDVALGLGAAHQRNIVHGAINPTHVLIGHDRFVKLTAFCTWNLSGGHYYAPEQAQGEAITAATEVYGSGIMMYQMLTGQLPFDGDTPVAIAMQHIHDLPAPPSQLNPDIPSSLEAIILRCLEKAPEMRYANGSQLARALETLSKNS